MFNNVALDVFIGLIAVFLLYSLLASILMEAVAKRLGLRARMTQKAIAKLLDDSGFTDEWALQRAWGSIAGTRFMDSFQGRPLTALFYAHPNIKNLGRNNFNRKPSDISPELFSDTFIQILRGDSFIGQQNQIDLINTNLNLNPNPPAKEGTFKLPAWYTINGNKQLWRAAIAGIKKSKKGTTEVQADDQSTLTINPLTVYQLKQFLFDSHSDIAVLRTRLVGWYNEMMDRATGWYIKQTRIILFIIGFILAVGFNVDTIAISTKLSKDKTVRDKMIEFAGKLPPSVHDSSVAAANKAFEEAYKNITHANQIIGNTLVFENINGYSIIGWLITAFAISLGAPFWFDLLGKIMSIRQAGNNSSEKTANEKKQSANTVSPKDRIG